MVDIIIVTYNAKDKLRHCLESVIKYTKGLKYLITVVDNKSIDGTRGFLKKHYKDKINLMVNEKNLGFSGAANIALKNTSAEFIVFLDDDTEVTKGWLKRLYQKLLDSPRVGIVGCKISYPNNRIFSADLRLGMKLAGKDEIDRGQRDYVKECDALVGACWLMKRELIKRVGFFDERFYPCQHEDLDYCLRTRLAGYKIIYNGKVKIIHHHLFRDRGCFKRNTQKLFKKWGKDILHKFPLKDSDPRDIHLKHGIEYIRKKKFSLALNEFKKAESFDKIFSEPYYKGLALEGLGRFKEAIQEFKKSVDIAPNFLSAYHHLASLYRKNNMNEECKDTVNKLFNLIPHYKNIL